MGQDAKKETVKRISAEDFWKLRDAGKEMDKAREAYQKWLRKRARQEKCYVDQLENTVTGKIRLDPTKECPAGEVKRASDKFIADAEPKFEELSAVVDKFNDLHESIAKEYGLIPSMIDHKTGVITGDDFVEAEKVVPEPKVKKDSGKE